MRDCGLGGNGANPQGALVIHNPLGATIVSNLSLQRIGKDRTQQNAPAGVVISADQPLPPLAAASVTLNKYTPSEVRDPIRVDCTAGRLGLAVKDVSVDSTLTGSLVRARVADATVDARFTALDIKSFKPDTRMFDWTYSRQASGVVVWEHTAVPFLDDQSNPFLFATRDEARGALVFSNAHLAKANSMSLDAYDLSTLQFRLEKYSWPWDGDDDGDANSFHVSLYAHDSAEIQARLVDGKKSGGSEQSRYLSYTDWIMPIVTFTADDKAKFGIENLEELAYDNPNSMGLIIPPHYAVETSLGGLKHLVLQPDGEGSDYPMGPKQFLFFNAFGETVGDRPDEKWPNNYLKYNVMS